MEAPFVIGDWVIEPQLNRVAGPEGQVTVEPRTMKVLVMLADNRGGVVTRDQLMDAVWEDTVVTEHSLTIAISDLRKLFGDDPKKPAVIETIRGIGYRLIAPIEERVSSRTPTLSISLHGDGMATSTAHLSRHRTKTTIWPVFTAAMAVMLIAGFFLLREQDSPSIDSITPLTTMRGVELSPAFSPDSRSVAFVAFPDSGLADIYIKQLGASSPVQFTNDQGAELMPVWSPDGQFIIYLSHGLNGCALFQRPSLGGAGMKLRDISCRLNGIAWAPDGKSLLISMYDATAASMRLYQLDLVKLELQPITMPVRLSIGDVAPRFSPDGRTLAFLRNLDGISQDIYLLDWQHLEAGPRPLTQGEARITGYDWTADGGAIVFATGRKDKKGLWRIDVKKPAEPALIRAISVEDPGSVSLAGSGKQLIYTDWTYEVNVWRMPVASDNPEDLRPAVTSTRNDYYPHISSENHLAFISTRTGLPEVWRAEADGTNPVQVSQMNSESTRHPAWSPDGTKIAFDSHANGQFDIYILDAEGGMPAQITTAASRDARPTWSADGEKIYFGSNRSGTWQLWSHELDSGTEAQVTERGGTVGWESESGDRLYYLRSDSSGVWEKSFSNGRERKLFDADSWSISYTGSYIYYIQPPAFLASHTIMRYRLDTEESEQVAVIPIKPFHYFARWGFAVSPDDSWLYMSRIDRSESDLMLTEGGI